MRKCLDLSRWVALLVLLALAGVAAADDAKPDERGYVGVPKIHGLRFLHLNEWGAEEWLRTVDGAVVIRVPGGPYLKRPYEAAGEFEDPKPVDVKSFFIDKHEVTNEQFARFMPQIPGPPPPVEPGDPPDKSYAPVDPLYGNTDDFYSESLPGFHAPTFVWHARPERALHPVTAATGRGAKHFAEQVGGRLPTVDEWEKAAGGPDGSVYPWGDAKPDATRANFGRPEIRGTMPVGSFHGGASPYGAMDMAGNVYERVYAPGRAEPVVIKGGSWLSPHPLNLRVLDMCVQSIEVDEQSVGFRVVMDDPQPDRPPIRRVAMPSLRLAADFSQAVEEAQERAVPIFLSLQYDTCGQCDRFRAQEMRDPRFIAYANEHLVVLVGHDVGDAVLASRKDKDKPALYPGLEDFELQSIFRQGLAVVGAFQVSPGNFLLDPYHVKPGAGPGVLLVGERLLPKSGGQVDTYLRTFESARATMEERHGKAKPRPVVRGDDDGAEDDD